ncbi:MAG: hypothetical protein KDB01_13220 [Planctomycetaceae bacterium]|nr:hypothetical protein [Planctomycetaceae bacterium]
MDQNTHHKSAPQETEPATHSFATDQESVVTTEFRSGTVADMQNREVAKEIDRREQERLAKEGPVAGMD